ncbi:Alanine racemase [Paenibacillus konkukensis]|uniref:Alanine racemase n=1 Tax=Paenibacillus konkukensis TaxID=2020716 RepID=A0ABY4RL09_9BACL|nr:alanine racemase [Paenibacillus konkukensis]UQZ82139.1 Alanine racemase [Paenibacillus konkukensis]
MYSYRDTRAEISLDAIYHNAAAFKACASPSCRLMAVVKADGYGHGAAAAAAAAMEAGADYLGVAFLDEALQLREAGIGLPILVLGYTPPRSTEAAVRSGVALTVFTGEALDCIAACAQRLQREAAVHLKIDTGMSRLGVTEADEALALARKAASIPGLRLEGVFTHFADADAPDPSYTERQFAAFTGIVERLRREGLSVPIAHCCNSAAALRFPQMHLDMIRIGISLYGLLPAPDANAAGLELKQAFRLKTAVASLKPVAAGQPVGYGCTYRPDRDIRVAAIPIGYADGLPRSLSNRGCVLIRGGQAPIIGRICMDQTMVDVTGLPDVRVGDEVTVYGGDPRDGAGASIDEVAALAGTINYEIVCAVAKRVPRVYRRHRREAGFCNAVLRTGSR